MRLVGFPVVGMLVVMASSAAAGVLHGGVLTVAGRPFFPLGSWNSTYTQPADIARLGMNTSYARVYDPTAAGIADARRRMRACRTRGLQVVAYVTPGPIKTGWSEEQARSFATLVDEPNLLVWYVGDDISASQLPAMEATASRLRKYAPGVPTVADFIGNDSPESRRTFRRSADIRSCYDYPLPGQPIREYMTLFDKYRAFAGDPMWTWVQNFMWGSTARRYNLGLEGAGPIPDPEQVRLLAHAAINRGVRGLLFFAHNQLHRLPAVAAEVALTCREIRLFNDHLAAGRLTMNLPTSNAEVNVAAFHLGTSTVLSAMVIGPHYHRWIDEGIVRGMSIECPWSGDRMPQALLVSTPDVVSCRVERVPGRKMVRVTVPALEVCGFILLSADARDAARLRAGVRAAAQSLCRLAPGAAAAQTSKVAGMAWQVGLTTDDRADTSLEAAQLADASGDALAAGKGIQAVRSWRRALRASRRLVTEVMAAVDARTDAVPESLRYALESPYALRNIVGLGIAPTNDEPFRFVTRWRVTGPFPLRSGGDVAAGPAPGFTHVYPPEVDGPLTAVFDGVDGPTRWAEVSTLTTGLSGRLDLRSIFHTTDNVVAYARATVTAPRDMEATLGIGSNDGARVWVNGEQVFTYWGGRPARKNETQVKVRLRKGPNVVLAKVANLGAGWDLYLALHDPARELVLGTD